MKIESVTQKDYIYCEDCKTYVDFWKYDYSLEDCGHDGCKWRFVMEEELKGCVEDCKVDGCFGEVNA